MGSDTDSLRNDILTILEPTDATAILDLGCGHGADLLSLANRVSRSCRLIGIDSSDKAIEAARSMAGDESRFGFQVHDLSKPLPFRDGEFDRILSVNLLEAIADKQTFLREVYRVMSPRGRVIFAHWDWDSQLFDGEDKAAIRDAIHAFADWKQAWMADADGWMGRRLWRTFQRSGLFRGEVRALVHTSTRFEQGCFGWDRAQDFRSLVKRELLPTDTHARVLADLDALASRNEYFYSITMYVYAGRKIVQ